MARWTLDKDLNVLSTDIPFHSKFDKEYNSYEYMYWDYIDEGLDIKGDPIPKELKQKIKLVIRYLE